MSHPSHCFSLAFAFNCRLPFLRRELITVFIFSCLHFHINFFPTNLQFRGCSMTLMLMAYITLLFHNSACFLKTWSAHFADAPTVSYSYPCLHSAVIQNFDLTKRDAKRPKISKLIPSEVFSHNLTAQPEDGYPQSRRCSGQRAKQTWKSRCRQEESFPSLSLGNCPMSGCHWRSLGGDHEGDKIQAACASSQLNIRARPGGEGCSVFKNTEIQVFPIQPESSVFPKQACENTQPVIPLRFVHHSEGFCQALTKLSENL